MVADGVEGEGQQIECDEQGSEVLLVVTVAVLDVIARVLKSVERLVFDPRIKSPGTDSIYMAQ